MTAKTLTRTVSKKNGKPAAAPVKLGPLGREELLSLARDMYMSRRLDDREILFKRQDKSYFQISGAGHEAVMAAAARVCKPAHDWFLCYYRDRALMVGLGMTPFEQLCAATGAAADPNSGGRQMPCHFGLKRANVISKSSCTGTQFNQAVGAAEAGMLAAEHPDIAQKVGSFQTDEIVLCTTGDGTTSQGEFWESLNTACLRKLPVLYIVEDNGFAISVPVSAQTAGGSISKLVASFPDLFVEECDGTDPVASYEALSRAATHCRERLGPALIHAHVIRPYSHSMSDDERMYRTDAERADEAARDPVFAFPKRLVAEGICTQAEIDSMLAAVDAEIQDAADKALAAPVPGPETIYAHLFSERVDPTSAAFATEPRFAGDPKTMADLLNSCLKAEMARNPAIVVFGEDVADNSREDLLDKTKGKGGVFKITHGLQKLYGSHRVFNSHLAEANIVGRAVGMAVRGLKPVVEIQFFDYIWPAFMQLRNELATMRWRSNGDFSAPVVVRVAYGGYLKGGAIYHSQTGESLFTHTPGLRVVIPSNALDANGLLRTAIRCDDPVIFLEHKHLYRQVHNRSQDPGPDFCIPFGKANIVRPGRDLTVITYGALVVRCMEAAKNLAQRGIDAEVIDLRTLVPYDWDTIAASVRKTSKVLVVYEDGQSWGSGTEIAMRAASELYEDLDGPVRRLGSADVWVGYQPVLENAILPQVTDVEKAIADLHAY